MLIEPYNPQWAQQFDQLKTELEQVLTGLEHTIEHVGSTAVPGLAAKPIIDIDIIYRSNEAFEKIKEALCKSGYYHNGNQGIADREVFKRNGTAENVVLDAIRHHLYVCPEHSAALKRHLLFRDCLRSNEQARATYQDIKYRLAAEAGQNQKVYAGLKEVEVNGFIDALIAIEKSTEKE
jgi:GrpB-like predicted nucleotidyltransferase (UPF0157 family)